MTYLPWILAAWLFVIGVYGVVTSRNLIHLVICLAVVQSSTYIALLSVGFKNGAAAPIFYDIPTRTPAVDPVVQALCLTDVVVEATVMAVLLALTVQAHKRFGTLDPEGLRPFKG
ncbi:MAG: sodium:proton antiporter [Candidatus Dormibacteraceae bacterium]